MDGIEVIRVWTFITANEGFAKRILDYVSFMVMAVPAALLVGKVDVILGTSPQFFTVWVPEGVRSQLLTGDKSQMLPLSTSAPVKS
jgi:hypothetical protein